MSHSATIRERRRGDGTSAHDVRFRHNGASRTRTFADRNSADRWAALVRSIGVERALLELERADKKVVTLDDVAASFLASRSGLEPKTMNHYESMYERLIAPTLGRLPVAQIDRTDVAQWIEQQRATGAAGKSIKNRHGLLSSIFKHGIDTGLLSSNPAARAVLPRTERKPPVFLTVGQYKQILEYIPPAMRPLVETIAGTGMRFGEATAIGPHHVDLRRRTIAVERAWKKSAGGAGSLIDGGVPSQPVQPAASAPAVEELADAPVVAGAVLTDEQALELRRNVAGDFHAYKTADGWVAVDKRAGTLPDAVAADVAVRVAAAGAGDEVTLPTGFRAELGQAAYDAGVPVIAVRSAQAICGSDNTLHNVWQAVTPQRVELECASTRDEAMSAATALAAARGGVVVVFD